MKKIVHFIVSAVALLAFAPFLNAQTIEDEIGELTFPQEKDTQVKSGVGFNKSISSPTSEGKYWIKLEAFSTGEATYTVTNEPADIVLVLDFSQSMTNQYSTTPTYVPAYVNNTYQLLNQQTRYIKYEGGYHQVHVQRLTNAQGQNVSFSNGGYAWAYFTIDDTTYYLDGDEIRAGGDHPVWSGTGNFSNNTVLWEGVLYSRETSVSRLEALKLAVDSFVDVIYHNDNYEDDTDNNPRSEPLGNRISIVIFSSVAATQDVLGGWKDVTTSNGEKNTSIMESFVAITNTPMQTHSEEGMSKAIDLLKQIKDNDPDRMTQASRTVVLFTDGAPGENPSWTDPLSTTVANACINNAKTVKTEYDATVFSVLVGTASGDMVTYMNAVTSNYPLASSLTDLGPICTSDELDEKYRKEEASFYKNAGDDLKGVFEEIAHQSGGSSDTQLTAQSPAVDVISSSFMLPENASADDILVFTAKCTYANKETGEYSFGDEKIADTRTETYDIYDEDGSLVESGIDVDDAIEVSLGKDENNNDKINVDGFDYAHLWCGPITDENNNVTYQGYKVIIMIPVVMNPDAVGGPNVATNAPGSGLFVNPDDEEPLVTFDSPTVSLPVNVYIEKIGLKPGESAKFKIERAVIPNKENWDPETDIAANAWTYVSTVFVTNGQYSKLSKNGYPMVKVRGMPATITVDEDGDGKPDMVDGKIIQLGVVYRITEENWAWSYDILDTDDYPNPQYTVTSKVDNPFSFKNEPKENIDSIVRHAESKATNVFKALEQGEKNERYVDSKKNVRNNTGGGSGSGEGGSTD